MTRQLSSIFAAAVVAGAVTALPAYAAEPDPAARPSAAATAVPGGKAASPTRYCIVDTPTGTRIERKECHTREEWMRRGFDPLARQ